jgi:hypothetical protein
MSVGLRRPDTEVDRPLLALVAVTAVLTAVGMLWLVRAAVGEGVAYRTIRVDNQAALPVQVDVVDGGGGRMGLGEAGPRAASTFREVADPGRSWTFVASYGGREVARLTLDGRELAGRGWTVQVPAAATAELERQGYR